MEEKILLCEDSLEGVFTAIYTAYEKHEIPERTMIQTTDGGNLRLFAVYESVAKDADKSARVIRTLRRRFGEEGFYRLCQALASEDEGKATAVYHTIVKGLRLERPAGILERYADPDVQKVQKLSDRVWREMDHLFGFVRFRELKNGVLFSEIHPRNHVLPYLAEHFADRLPMEHFLICDSGRSLFAVHPAGQQWFLAGTPSAAGEGEADSSWKDRLEESAQEAWYQELFRRFCHKISIEARENETLQKGMLPLHYRPYMTEFDGN